LPRKDRRYKPRKNMDEVPEINPKSYKLNKTLTKKMCKYIEEGNYISTACKLCGIERHTHYDWIKYGKKGIKPFKEYYLAIEEAKAKAEASMVDVITSSALEDGNVGASQWWLARMYPDRWAKKDRVEAKVDTSQKIEIVTVSPTKEGDTEEE
jgi:hypothetical protein